MVLSMTALMWASVEGHTEVVRLLLDRGAMIDEMDHYEEGWTALMKASWEGNTEMVQLLLDKAASLEKKDFDGMNALMLASKEGHTELVQLLLDAGALLNEKDTDGYTALMLASMSRRVDVDGHTSLEVVQKRLLQDGDVVCLHKVSCCGPAATKRW